MSRIALALVLLAPSAAAAVLPASDAVFSGNIRAGFDLIAASRKSRKAADGRFEARLEKWLGWYGTMMSQPSFDADRMSAIIVEGVRGGTYRGLIMGETHGVPQEERAGRRFTGDVLDAGVKVGVFIREQNLYGDTSALDARGIPVLTYRNQFVPESDISKALDKAGQGLAVSYTGAAHAGRPTKDYFLYTLLEGLWAGYGPGKKDMPTVEDSLDKHGRSPLIVAMTAESHVVSRIQQLFLAELAQAGSALPELRSDLDSVIALWTGRFALWPRRGDAIAFAQDPRRPNVYLGMTPADRRPLELVAVAQVLADPDLPAWLGSARITTIESLRATTGDVGRVTEIHWDVILHSQGKPDFRRTIQGSVVRAAAPPLR